MVDPDRHMEIADELPEEGAYQIGSLAMANSGPDTNGSQFFIISGERGAALPPLYSLFGQIGEDDLDVGEGAIFGKDGLSVRIYDLDNAVFEF